MQITKQTDYAIRCVLFLSRSPDKVFMIDSISAKMNIPRSFLAKILQRLAKAGIVESLRGVKGGFRIARKPSDISLLDVVEAIEGSVAMNKCAVDKKLCELSNTCSVHPVWVEIRKDVETRLKKWTFARLSGLIKE